MKTVLITGVAGMIGSNLAHHILENTEYNVVGLDNFSGGYSENLPAEGSRFKMYSGNVGDQRVLFNIFTSQDIDIVYHAAAYAAEGLSPFIRRFNYGNNVVGTANVVNFCIEYNVERLIFFSSIAVYGRGWGELPFREVDTPNPIDPYGIAKYACEMDIKVAGEQHKLDWVIVRAFNVYGERQNIWDKYRNVLGIWFYNYLNGKPLEIYGDGQQSRSFTYIEDILDPLLKFSEDPKCSKQIYNLGSNIPYTLNQAAKVFENIVGACEVKYLHSRHEVRIARPDISKVSSLTGEPTLLSEGLSKMWAWVKQQPLRERRPDELCEITNGLYENWR